MATSLDATQLGTGQSGATNSKFSLNSIYTFYYYTCNKQQQQQQQNQRIHMNVCLELVSVEKQEHKNIWEKREKLVCAWWTCIIYPSLAIHLDSILSLRRCYSTQNCWLHFSSSQSILKFNIFSSLSLFCFISFYCFEHYKTSTIWFSCIFEY